MSSLQKQSISVWSVSELDNKNKRVATSWNPGIVGTADKQPSVWICDRQDLYRKTKKCLCPGVELLFLSRSDRGLSDRFTSGSDRKLELQNSILCSGLSDLYRSFAWQTGLWIPVSVWIDSGSVE